MGASNHPDLKYAKPRARALDDDEESRSAKQHQKAVYAVVDVRDKRQCTICGRRGNPNATTTLGKLHHEHLKELSLGGPTKTSNVVLACWICHPFKTAHQIEPTGNPDRGTLRYTVTGAAAKVIFKCRRPPAHVRIVDGE
jgi:5-methylcytosine-specific restriction endonuclease McrA